MKNIKHNAAPGKPRAIETIYRGYRFRSRLEARWAVLFDKIGLAWTYEEEGFELPSGRYLPDFFFPELNVFVEIKGRMPDGEDRDLARLSDLSVAKNCACFMFAGDPIDLLERPMDESYTWRIPAGHELVSDGQMIAALLEASGLYGTHVGYPMTEKAARRTVALNIGLGLQIASFHGWLNEIEVSGSGAVVAKALANAPRPLPEGLREGAEQIQEDLVSSWDANRAKFDEAYRGIMSAMRFVSYLSGDRMKKAAAISRQARFEFGETPK